jgi:hypothetical protein
MGLHSMVKRETMEQRYPRQVLEACDYSNMYEHMAFSSSAQYTMISWTH